MHNTNNQGVPTLHRKLQCSFFRVRLFSRPFARPASVDFEFSRASQRVRARARIFFATSTPQRIARGRPRPRGTVRPCCHQEA